MRESNGPPDWPRIREILDRAFEASPAEHPALLRELCGDDVALRVEVEALLAAEARAGRLLEAPLAEFADLLVDELAGALSEPDTLTGRQVGAYRLVRELARGGMGTVYLAERADRQYTQHVAVKVLRRGLDTDDVLRRFLAERQILASLEHPNIARLLDGGATGDGRPYLVMEYVDGRPIDAYCDERRLSIDERLALFRSVVRVVQYAHRNLVVHRDLKPRNILVTDAGEVKLLDFGIAKLLQPGGEARGDPRTRTGVLLLTPEYASPEQVRGGTITTASDVYQLGLLLYELLTGRRPYRLHERSAAEIERIVCEQPVPRPSTVVAAVVAEVRAGSAALEAVTMEVAAAHADSPGVQTIANARRTTPERLRARLRGDLDAIVLQALRKEPEQRYASAEALGDDVDRHCARLPVGARGESRSYRIRRFVGRHRAAVAAGVLLFVLLATYAATIRVHAHRIAHERDRADTALVEAELRTAQAEEVAGFMIGLFEAGHRGESWGQDVTGRELLERGSRRIEELTGQPALQAKLHEVIGQTYLRLAVFSQAAPHLERALELRHALPGEQHVDVARSLHDLATLHRSSGRLAEADELLVRAVEIRRTLPDHAALAASLYALARTAAARDDVERAAALYAEALTALRQTPPGEGVELARLLDDYGLLLHRRGELDAAEALFREALAEFRRVRGERSPFVAGALNNLALVELEREAYAPAEALLREAVAIQVSLLGEESPLLSTTLHNLAFARLEQGDHTAADSLAHRALALAEGPARRRTQYTAVPLIGLGRIKLRQRDAVAAEAALREAALIRRSELPVDHWQVADANGWLGAALSALGRYEEAEPLVLAGHAGLERALGPHHRRTREAVSHIVALYEELGRADDAARYRQLTPD